MYAPGIDLKVYNFTFMLESYNTTMLMRYRNEKPIAMTISFNTPIDINLMDANRTNESFAWTKKQREIYGKIIIKDMHVTAMKNNRVSNKQGL